MSVGEVLPYLVEPFHEAYDLPGGHSIGALAQLGAAEDEGGEEAGSHKGDAEDDEEGEEGVVALAGVLLQHFAAFYEGEREGSHLFSA